MSSGKPYTLRELFSDLCILSGAGAVVYGTSAFSIPAACIVAGVLLLAAGLRSAR